MTVIGTSDLVGKAPGGRKLIAIVYADMVGYSRLIGMDDIGTLGRLRTLRHALIDPAIDEHGGRIVQTGGDSLLIVFDSLDGAVRCAVQIQQSVPGYHGDQPPDRAIRFRVGVNIGDVIADGTDLHGDGVNVAVRLEAECPPGGVCVSRAVRDHVRGRADLVFEELGPLKLKNIIHPVEAFVLRFHDVATIAPASLDRSAAKITSEVPRLPDKPSIAVLAFTNMSGDPDQEYFSDGVADDIITELSHSRSLFVIARNSSFTYKGRAVGMVQVARELGVRYVLGGSTRRSGGQIRVNAQLIDAETDNHIWAERYDRAVEGVFALQDEITAAVVRAIHPAVADAERRRAMRKAPENLGAWEAYQRGLWHVAQNSPAENEKAKEFFRRAVELDPMLSAALVSLAIALIYDAAVYGTAPQVKAANEAMPWARKAISIDPDDADAQAVLALALAATGASDEAWVRVSKALAIHPNSWLAKMVAGRFLMWRGQPVDGRALLEAALRMNPRDPVNPFFEGAVMSCYFFERNYLACVEAAKRAISDRPGFPQPYRWLVAALGHLGRANEAREALHEAYAVSPGAMAFFTQGRPPHVRIEDHDHILDGLRKAGWDG
jgi:adenylate cyclase